VELGLDVPAEVLTAGEIGRTDRTASALQVLAVHLQLSERDAVAEWTAEQARELDMDIDAFDGNLYLEFEDLPMLQLPFA
jgi:hypothetical protein